VIEIHAIEDEVATIAPDIRLTQELHKRDVGVRDILIGQIERAPYSWCTMHHISDFLRGGRKRKQRRDR
jgi:hypothetical protein